MRGTHRRRPAAICAALLLVALVAGCTTSEATTQPHTTKPKPSSSSQPENPAAPPSTPAKPPPGAPGGGEGVALKTDRARQSPGVVAAGGRDAPYNYAPSVIVDGGRYRMWWCSQLGVANPPGDDILLAESKSTTGPFVGPDGTSATPVFSGSHGGFDGMHTCDPSVLKVGGTYYMYYTGAAGDHAHGNAIGVATSPDGRVWSRANGGKPIVNAARHVDNGNTYGAGQPSAVYVAGYFYLMFTDTTGRKVGHNGAGQFVLRSPDPTFTRDVQTLTADGFRDAKDTLARDRTVVDAFSADWMWVDSLASFAIAHETLEGTTITFWDIEFSRNPYRQLIIPGPWREGPGLIRRADGHAVLSTEDPCGRVSFDVMRASREAPNGPSDLRHFGVDAVGIDACTDPGRALLALDGFAMPSPQRTIDLIVGGKVVRIDRRSVAAKVAVRILDQRIPVLDKVPVDVHIKPGSQARTSQGRGVAFMVDDKLWRIGSPQVAELNSSMVREIPAARWDSYERGPDLVGPPR